MTVGPDSRNRSKFMAQTLVRDNGAAGDMDAINRPARLGELSPFADGRSIDAEDWQTGMVADWIEEKGYGFVELGDGRRIYVHHTSFGGGSLMAGLELEIIPARDTLHPGKWRAAQARGPAVIPKGSLEPPHKRARQGT